MSATFSWTVTNTSGAVSTDLGASGNLQNYQNADLAGIAFYATNPIVAGNNSFEVWLRAHITGVFNLVRDFRFWQSTAFSPATGLQIYWKGTQQIYLTPSSGTSSIATSSIPTADPGTANVSIGGNLSGSLTTSGYTDYIVTQLRTTVSAAAGDTSLTTVTLSYTEN